MAAPLPDAARRTLAIATAAVWIVAYAAWTADWLITPMGHGVDRALRRIPICLMGAALCWSMAAPLRATAAWPLARRLALAGGLCAIGALLEESFSKLLLYAIAPRWGAATGLDVLTGALNDSWVFLAWAALYFTLDADARARDADLARADAEAALLETRNRALLQQIAPHFLFNALNTVSGLVLEGQAERANRTVMALSRLLRGSLERELPAVRPLGAELTEQGGYVEVQAARFEDRFHFVDAVPEPLRDWPVPSLILQPILENAFTHGVARTDGLVTLTVGAEQQGARLRLVVTDDARPISPKPGSGLGLDNVRRRLAALYGDDAQLQSAPAAAGGWRVELLIPQRPR